ncbi:GMC oxidoreductase [Leifsonia sp. McL0607]|uniref:GMC oxidoreductase n=1 Tax=Leifsonia sp. McL0607 TaxID=3415672 RepID=UPI003CE8BA27
MAVSRRTLLASGAAAAAAAAVSGLSPTPAIAAPLPAGATAPRLLDTVAAAKYRLLVPEIFVAPPAAPAHTPALVIGSGFGAAIAALRLARAGIRTAMLERGLPWPRDPKRAIFSGNTPPDGRAFWHRRTFTGVAGIPAVVPKFGGVLDATDYDHIQVWRGAAVGGGSVVFTGVLIEPEERFFRAVFGDRVDFDRMHEVYYPRARAHLNASPMPDDVYRSKPFGHSRVWDDQARRAGYEPQPLDSIFDWDVVRAELSGRSRPSAIIGESNLGNSNAAKYDLTRNVLPAALGTGHVTLHHSHVVDAIGREPSGRYWVEVREITANGSLVRSRRITCDQLFLGAGSIGTSELLVKAKALGTLPSLSSAVGAGWGTNGDAALVRSFSHPEGLTQAAPSASRILDESGLPLSLENWYVPGLPVDVGLIGSLGMVLDPTRASFRYDPAKRDVVLDWPSDGNERAVAAMRAVHDRIAAANGLRSGVLGVAPDINASFTAHPLGGAVLGEATDTFGRVHGYDGLYVIDGAAVPGSTGTVNPTLTIVALAERAMDDILEKGR